MVDTTPTVITVEGDNPATVELGATYTDAGATADGGETVTTSGTVDTSTLEPIPSHTPLLMRQVIQVRQQELSMW